MDVSLVQKNGRICLPWNLEHRILLTRIEFIRLRRRISQPSNERLLNLPRLARPQETDSKTTKILEYTRSHCQACQIYDPLPMRFKIALQSKENFVFGNELSIHLMFLDEKKVFMSSTLQPDYPLLYL